MKIRVFLLFLLFISLTTIVPRAQAISSGYERFQDSECEVYVEYFPIIPFDPRYPTASEEFPIKFYLQQNTWKTNFGFTEYQPAAFQINVFYRDDTCASSYYPTWKRWYPTTTSHRGYDLTWRLTAGYEGLSLGVVVSTKDIYSSEQNYTEIPITGPDGKEYIHMGSLYNVFWSHPWFGQTITEGAGSIGIPNDLAMSHEGHHGLVLVRVLLLWTPWTFIPPGVWIPGLPYIKQVYFILGDDIPSDTDCLLYVAQGDTSFSADPPGSGGGGGGCPRLSVWDGLDYIEEGLLDIHNPEGIDVVNSHTLATMPERVDGAYVLRLVEHPQTISHIDQVELYAILENGNTVKLPLIQAWHSEDSNVLPILLRSDDRKMDIAGANHNNGISQSIDLKFAALDPNMNAVAFIFRIEGNNIHLKR